MIGNGVVDATSLAVTLLLNRLSSVRKYGQGWRAKCPVHGGKSTGSLSVAEGDDGRVLIHCFGGCEPLEILKVCGLEMADLFPERIDHYTTPEQKNRLRELARLSRTKAAAEELNRKATILVIGMKMLREGAPINERDATSIDHALESIYRIKGDLANV